MKQFVLFPFSLYKDNPYWVPPIVKDEIACFTPSKNPVFENAGAQFFIAIINGKIVGRIAAIINWLEVEKQQIKKMRFGWFDVIDDLEVSKALLQQVQKIGSEHHLEYLEGPVGFNNLDKTGVLVEGFNHLGTSITWYNHPYYKEHLEQLGFVKEKEYLENKFQFKNVDAVYFNRISTIIRRRFQLKALNFTKTKDLLPYVDEMFEVLEKSYGKLATFLFPISKAQINFFQKRKYIRFYQSRIHTILWWDINHKNSLLFAIVHALLFRGAFQKSKKEDCFPFGLIFTYCVQEKTR